MLNGRFCIEPIDKGQLASFLATYSIVFDYPRVEDIFKITTELAFSQEDVVATNVIHACYDNQEEKYCAIINLGTTTDIDDIVSIAVEFFYINPEYRKEVCVNDLGCKLSHFLLLDYVIGEIAYKIKKEIGISMVGIVPMNDIVREIYEGIGFASIKNPHNGTYEDWMTFPL